MGQVKNGRIKRSMTVTFLITVCAVGILSGATIFFANRAQQEILRNRYATIRNPHYTVDEHTGGIILAADQNEFEWHELSPAQNAAYYGCYFAMIGLPVLYIVGGIGMAAAVYYRVKLREPICQLQDGIRRIQENDLDFQITYTSGDELGSLCGSMEKMRGELRQNYRQLWEALEQRKLLNESVAHDLRTPITVLQGYLDFLEKNIPADRITEEMLMETVASMQGAVQRLARYTEGVREAEKLEGIRLNREDQDTADLLREMESNVRQLADEDTIIFRAEVPETSVCLDRSVLFRILENLLQNAMRYRKKQVIVEVSRKGRLLLITVQDDGNGFSGETLWRAAELPGGYSALRPEETQGSFAEENTFDESFCDAKEKPGAETQGESARDRCSGSGEVHFGIGLGICRLLCEKHGGYLKIENIIGGEGICEGDETDINMVKNEEGNVSGAAVTAALDVARQR